jgi:hypothetical protein
MRQALAADSDPGAALVCFANTLTSSEMAVLLGVLDERISRTTD